MAEFKRMIVTNIGQNTLAQLIANSKTINFNKICTSSAILTQEELASLKTLTNVKQTIPVAQVKVLNNTDVKISTTISNEALTEGYDINSIALYVKNENNEEILYSIASVEDAEKGIYIPSNSGTVSTEIGLSILTTVANADNVNFEINPTGFASKGELEDAQNQIEVNKLKTYTTTLAKISWTLNETTNLYEYNVIKEDITSNHIVTVDPASFEDKEKYSGDGMVNSYNGGFKITATELPEDNINVVVIYQLATDVTPPIENSEVTE